MMPATPAEAALLQEFGVITVTPADLLVVRQFAGAVLVPVERERDHALKAAASAHTALTLRNQELEQLKYLIATRDTAIIDLKDRLRVAEERVVVAQELIASMVRYAEGKLTHQEELELMKRIVDFQ